MVDGQTDLCLLNERTESLTDLKKQCRIGLGETVEDCKTPNLDKLSQRKFERGIQKYENARKIPGPLGSK
jgi:hypothetical protein